MCGIEAAERNPEAAVQLAKACMKLVSEATSQLRREYAREEAARRAYEDLETAERLFRSVVAGRLISKDAEKVIPYGADASRVLILDVAHSYVHKAINHLKESENVRDYSEAIELLNEARRTSAPKTLYKLVYEIAG